MNKERNYKIHASVCLMAMSIAGIFCSSAPAQTTPDPHTRQAGLCVYPGAWRPWFEWEHIAWVRTPWSDPLFPDCVWLDFPEAIFSNEGLWFLSHINPGINSIYPELPEVPWQHLSNGIVYTRTLPNGFNFAGILIRRDDTTIDYELRFDNDSNTTLSNITLQTCCFLKASNQFSQGTQDNKYVHTPSEGWVTLNYAATLPATGLYSVGWRGGPKVADSPWVLAKSVDGQHWVGMTWFEDTLSFIGNPSHPCVHADPLVGTLTPGQTKIIHGRLAFFTGTNPDVFNLPDYYEGDSPCLYPLLGDLDEDCDVDVNDLVLLAGNWLASNPLVLE